MDLGSSFLHRRLVRNCTQLIEEKSGARICCPVDGNSVLVRGSLESAYFASEMIAVCSLLRVLCIFSKSMIQYILLGRDSIAFKVPVPIVCGDE